MIYVCLRCNQPVFLRRSDDKPLPNEMKICYPCEKKIQRKEIKSELGYSRVGLNNI